MTESAPWRKSQANAGGPPGPPPPPPSFPGSLPGRRLKTELPERSQEPPAAIQNAMMTKDKKPFTYTPGGLDLSEIRSPKMQRRINRNACADEMHGEHAPTTNQLSPPGSVPPGTFSPMQSQLPTAVFPGGAPPPPPPPPPGSANSMIPPSAATPTPPKPSVSPHRPQQGGFDPNEILTRVNRNHNVEPKQDEYQNNTYSEPVNRFKPQEQQREQEYYEPKRQPNEIQFTRQNEPGHIYVPQIAPKLQNEPGSIYIPPVPNNTGRSQLGSIYIPPVTNINQEPSTPSSASSYGYTVQSPPSTATPTSPLSQIELNKAPTPWMNLNKSPQNTVPAWVNREPEAPKPSNTRIIPIQIEGRDTPSPNQKQQQQQQYQQQQQQQQQQQYQQQQQQYQQPQRQQQPQQQQQQNSRIIPAQMENSPSPNFNQQQRSGYGYPNQNKFNTASPSSPTPYSPPTAESVLDQKPQWAPVQARPSFKMQQRPSEDTTDGQSQVRSPQQRFHQPENYQQPEYGTYNTAGVPLSQLRKMQLSEDDKALMDRFKAQVDDETYLHRESDPRYRGAAIPSRAFRMLQCMTDTAGDIPQQVPRSNLRTPVSRPQSAGPFQQEVPQGPYIPPSEQQVQEPRKYTGGSIPSRSFRMLQAMTGQDGTGSNISDL